MRYSVKHSGSVTHKIQIQPQDSPSLQQTQQLRANSASYIPYKIKDRAKPSDFRNKHLSYTRKGLLYFPFLRRNEVVFQLRKG